MFVQHQNCPRLIRFGYTIGRAVPEWGVATKGRRAGVQADGTVTLSRPKRPGSLDPPSQAWILSISVDLDLDSDHR
jgi:hypothetical protein